MGCLIAITGKGGVGKTTIAGLMVTQLAAMGQKPILAVDADPNTCLDAALGITVRGSVGAVREETRKIAGKGLAGGISKQEMLELKITQCLVEEDDFDFIAMGRPEGHGCYCYANNVLRSVLTRMVGNYPYTVIDNEAGLENLSRRIIQKVDVLVMVSDPSRRGLDTVKRLRDLAKEMEIVYKKLVIVVNRLQHPELPEYASALAEHSGADIILGLPDNKELALIGEMGTSLRSLAKENAVSTKIRELLRMIL